MAFDRCSIKDYLLTYLHSSSVKIGKCCQLQGALPAEPLDSHYRLALRALAMGYATSLFPLSSLITGAVQPLSSIFLVGYHCVQPCICLNQCIF